MINRDRLVVFWNDSRFADAAVLCCCSAHISTANHLAIVRPRIEKPVYSMEEKKRHTHRDFAWIESKKKTCYSVFTATRYIFIFGLGKNWSCPFRGQSNTDHWNPRTAESKWRDAHIFGLVRQEGAGKKQPTFMVHLCSIYVQASHPAVHV